MILDYFSVYFGTFFGVFGGPGGFRGHLGPKPGFYRFLVKFGIWSACWLRLGRQDEAQNFTFMLKKVLEGLRGAPGGVFRGCSTYTLT